VRAVRLLAAIVVAMMVQVATAQDYPGSKPIRLIVPFPPGGGTDIFARQIADKLRATSNWTVVVDNKAGAGGNIGIEATANAPGDGLTIALGQTSTLAINPSLYA